MAATKTRGTEIASPSILRRVVLICDTFVKLCMLDIEYTMRYPCTPTLAFLLSLEYSSIPAVSTMSVAKWTLQRGERGAKL